MTEVRVPQRVWLITGAGRGLGRAFTLAALAAGDRVVGTARRPADLDELHANHQDSLQVLQLDVTDRAAVLETARAAINCFGQLDVVVNNAGYGHVGVAEELTERELREQLDTNFFGAVWLTQAVLPHLRQRRTGHIVQVSTVGAVGSMPAFGAYNASKWALEGFTEALAAEVAGFGIRVTIAELGGFATDWAWSSLRFSEPNADYDELRRTVFGSPTVPWDTAAQGTDDDTDADPAAAATALLAHIDADQGPLRLLIGDDAPTLVGMALERRRDDYRQDARFRWPS